MKAKQSIALICTLVAAGLLVGGCGSGGGYSTRPVQRESTTTEGRPSSGGEVPSEAQSAATGDIPDNQTFLLFRDPQAGYAIRYPEGWARKGSANDVTFQEKANVIHISVGKGAPRNKPGVKSTYSGLAPPTRSPASACRSTIDRYEYAHGGKVAVLDLATPVGVDNVDAYRMISESFRWQSKEPLPRAGGRAGATAVAGAGDARRLQDLSLRRRWRPSPCAGSTSRCEQGELVAILGPSGCGKSTLLALAAGLDRAFGRRRVAASAARSIALERGRARRIPGARRRHRLPERQPLADAERAGERRRSALRLGGRRGAGRARGRGARGVRARRAPGITGRRRSRAASSSGWRSQPPWPAGRRSILADEPTGELDTANQQVVLDALRRLPRDARLRGRRRHPLDASSPAPPTEWSNFATGPWSR